MFTILPGGITGRPRDKRLRLSYPLYPDSQFHILFQALFRLPTSDFRLLNSRFFLLLLALAAICLGLPLLGTIVSGLPLQEYFQFPPRTHFREQPCFSPSATCAFAVITILLVAIWIMGRPAHSPVLVPSPSTHRYRLPTWGWFGLGFGAVTWVLA